MIYFPFKDNHRKIPRKSVKAKEVQVLKSQQKNQTQGNGRLGIEGGGTEGAPKKKGGETERLGFKKIKTVARRWQRDTEKGGDGGKRLY